MPKYSVELVERVTYTVEVEADNEEEARESATEAWAQSDDPDKDFDGGGQGVSVIDCVEIDDSDKPLFKVLVQQYVEETAEIEVRANTIEEARDIALKLAPEADWEDGNDSYAAAVYAVKNEDDQIIWERG